MFTKKKRIKNRATAIKSLQRELEIHRRFRLGGDETNGQGGKRACGNGGRIMGEMIETHV